MSEETVSLSDVHGAERIALDSRINLSVSPGERRILGLVSGGPFDSVAHCTCGGARPGNTAWGVKHHPPGCLYGDMLRAADEIADSIKRSASHYGRVEDLIRSNNMLQQEARDGRLLMRGYKRGIYFSSKVRHAVTWRALRAELKAEGIPVISTWIDEAGQGESKSLADLWRRNILEASTAEVLIIYREPDESLKGAWIEMGAALSHGVQVFAVGIEQFTVAHDERVRHWPTLDFAIEAARAVVKKAA